MTNLAAIEARMIAYRKHPPTPVIERKKFEQVLEDLGWCLDHIERLEADR